MISQASSSSIQPKRKGHNLRDLPPTIDAGDWDEVSDEFVEQFTNVANAGSWPLYLYGPVGRGKTFAMAAVFRRWPGNALWLDFQPWLRLVMACRRDGSTYRPGTDHPVTEGMLIREVDQAPIVCIDDCGIRADSEAQQSVFLEVLNIRKRKPTIVTGNHEPGQLHKVFDSRIASRLMAGVIFKMNGPDRRMQGTKVIEIG